MADAKRSQKRSKQYGGSKRVNSPSAKGGRGAGCSYAEPPVRSGRQGRSTQRAVQSAPQRRDVHAAAGNFIEGRRAAFEALHTGFPVKRALIAQGVENEPAIRDLLQGFGEAGVSVKGVPRSQLDAISSHGAHQGIVLEVGAFPYADLSDIIAAAPADRPALVVVLDHVTDAGNFGAIVRSAEIVGAAGVVIPNKRAAEVTIATYKTSAGAVMHLPIAQVPNIARALEDLKAAGFWVGGATEHATDVCWDSPFEGRVALVMGSEGDGISRLVLDTCDFTTKLPQRGATESLNVAQAATALCFEWLRRNRSAIADAPAMGE